MNAAGHQVEVFAPTAEASRGVLRAEGFERAETVARLLQDDVMQRSVAGKVLWIDEAGLLSARQMRHVFQLAEAAKCRVVLSGDSAQHGPVERGDALSILERHAGLKTAELGTIRRQQLPAYREAVQSLSRGDSERGFQQLDQLGWIREASREEFPNELAAILRLVCGAANGACDLSDACRWRKSQHGHSAILARSTF
ncbi:MAG: AAA family ATPase [Candidatus Competibacteraceae bacterium]|nr:AAA family ATPase [Candidatus Competibacteraceae bacterium]